MKLYFAPGACSLATHIVLEWIGKPYETQKVEIHGTKSPALVKHNPLGAVPVLEDGGFWLTQNSAILNYLADRFPDAGIAGDGTPRGRAEVNRWLGFVNSDMHPVFKAYFGAADYLGDAKLIAKAKANAGEILARRFAVLDAQLAGREWLASARHSIADPYAFVLARWAAGVGIDLGGMKNLQAFVAHMNADAGVQRVLAAEEKAA